MSVDFSQFFNGPIRDSLIAQVSDYLDISRPQATTAYDKAVALVIGAMARQAGKPEGARELAAHIHNSHTQTSLTSSALSPTVLTNDQFAQIVTLGQSEQAVILGAQQEPVTSHLEVATGLDTQAVGSLLSIVVPFVLSFLKNNITTESTPAKALPVLLATQAPHVAAQLDAPALAALGEDSLEGLFGADALAAANANSAAASPNGRQGAAQGAAVTTKPANGWFKWVLTLAVVLAGAAWIKSCTQSDTTDTENAKPAEQQQSTTDAPAADNVTTTPAAPAADTTTGEGSKANEPGGAAEPSANFPEPAATQSASAGASATTGEGAQAGQEQPETTPPEHPDQSATPDAPTTSAATDAAPPATDTAPSTGGQPESEPSQSADANADASATGSVQPAAGETAANASASPAEATTDGPTYGEASDSMEPDPQESAAPAAAPADTSAADSSTEPAGQQAAEATHETRTDSAPADTTDAGHTSSDQPPVTEGATPTTTASEASGAAAEQAAPGSAATDKVTTGGTTADSTAADKAATDGEAADNATSGKTTTFAEPAPLAEKPQAAGAAQTAAPQDTTGRTTTFGESEAFDNAVKPAQSQEDNTDQSSNTPAASETGNGGTTQPSPSAMSSGKTTTFGAAEPDIAASTNTTQTESTAASTGAADQSAASTADSAQANASPVARVQLERDGDALRISGTVPAESARNRILNAAKLIDGHSKIEDELKVDSQAAALAFDDYSGLLSLLRGYHDVNVSLEPTTLTLTGQVSSDAEKAALTTRVQNLLGGDIQVDNQVSIVASAQTSATEGAGAPAAIPLVQFASGSAQVDSRFHDSLDKYAQQLKESGKSVRLVGYADESGSEPGNETLSQRRAESVKAYLILRGVQAQQIRTEGQGTQAPVADNTTQEGRARNRRVEIREQ